jgi:hypothetical protein
MQSSTAQQEEVRGMAVLDHVPEGWRAWVPLPEPYR